MAAGILLGMVRATAADGEHPPGRMRVGLAAKNAILVVEFAKQAEERGVTPAEAATQAARTRLRPIPMISFAFMLGVIPLVMATGAGAEMRQTLGTTVFFGSSGSPASA